MIGAQNMTSFHLEQTINKRIHLRKTETEGKKSAGRPARCVRFEVFRKRFLSLHYDPPSHFIYMQVHDVFRNYASMRAFDGSRSLVQWKIAPSSLLYFSMEVKKIVVPSLTKNGVTRTIYW